MTTRRTPRRERRSTFIAELAALADFRVTARAFHVAPKTASDRQHITNGRGTTLVRNECLRRLRTKNVSARGTRHGTAEITWMRILQSSSRPGGFGCGRRKHGSDTPGRGARKGCRLTEPEWELLEPLLPQQTRMGRPWKHRLRVVLDAILHLLRTGCPQAAGKTGTSSQPSRGSARKPAPPLAGCCPR